MSGVEQIGDPEEGHHRECSGGHEERRQAEKRPQQVLASRPGTEFEVLVKGVIKESNAAHFLRRKTVLPCRNLGQI